MNEVLFDNIQFKGLDIFIFAPAGEGEQAGKFFVAEHSVGIQKFGLRENDFADIIITDAHAQIIGGSLHNGVDEFFLHNILQNGHFHGFINIKIFAEKVLSHLQLVCIFGINFGFCNFDIINFNHGVVFAGTADIAGNPEQRHKAQRG